ncbi:MAG: AAA family ATPase [Gemmatimonadales bacterium]
MTALPHERAVGYPYDIPAIRHLDRLKFTTPVTCFVGENGSGKSTLLEAIAGSFGLNPEGGTKHARFSTRHSHSDLFRKLRLEKTRPACTDSYFLRAESFYNLATVVEDRRNYHAYDEDAGGGRSLHEQSHGESFLALVLHRLRGNGFYLFDEPEAALSPSRQLALLAAMHRLVRRGSQFIMATHSPILLAYPGATIYLFGDHPPRPVAYTDTEHYSVTRAFLEHPERMLRELLRD